MLILMTNPKHGSMYVYNEGDAVRHEGLGWVRAVAEPIAVAVAEAEQVVEPVAAAVAAPKAKLAKTKRAYVRKGA